MPEFKFGFSPKYHLNGKLKKMFSYLHECGYSIVSVLQMHRIAEDCVYTGNGKFVVVHTHSKHFNNILAVNTSW